MMHHTMFHMGHSVYKIKQVVSYIETSSGSLS